MAARPSQSVPKNVNGAPSRTSPLSQPGYVAPADGASYLQRAIDFAQRALAGKPERSVSVAVGLDSGVDFRESSAFDLSVSRSSNLATQSPYTSSPYEISRIERYRAFREMAVEVPELKRGLRVLVSLAFGGEHDHAEGQSFRVQFGDAASDDLIRVAESTVNALGLQAWAPSTLYEGLWLGDSFSEQVYGGEPLTLMAQQPHMPEAVRVMVDEFNRLAYYWVFVQAYGVWTAQSYTTVPRQLSPFQMVHYAPDRALGTFYGEAQWDSGRDIRHKSAAFEDIMTMLGIRKAAGDVMVLWPFPAEQDRTKIKQWLRDAAEAANYQVNFDSAGKLTRKAIAQLDTKPRLIPYHTIAGMDLSPEVVETKAADFNQLVDVLRYYQERLVVVGGVPAALIGIDSNVNGKNTLEQQGIHFALTLRGRQHEIATLVMDIITRALLVAGIVPEPGDVEIVMPEVTSFDAQIQAQIFSARTLGVKTLVESGVALRDAMRMGFGLTEEDLDGIADGAEAAAGADVGSSATATAEAIIEAVKARDEANGIITAGPVRAGVKRSMATPANHPAA